MKKIYYCFLSLFFVIETAHADLTATFYAVNNNQLQTSTKLGTATLSENPHGVIVTPNLKDLPPGIHSLRRFEANDCKKVLNKLIQQPVMDAKQALSFLPPIVVDATGHATSPLIAPGLKLNDLNKQVLLIYGDPLEYPDQTFPAMAGIVIACAVIEKDAE